MRKAINLQSLARPLPTLFHVLSLIPYPLSLIPHLSSLLSPLHQRHFPPALVVRDLVKKGPHQNQAATRLGIERARLPGSGNRGWIESRTLVADHKPRLIGVHGDVHANLAI